MKKFDVGYRNSRKNIKRLIFDLEYTEPTKEVEEINKVSQNNRRVKKKYEGTKTEE